MFSENKRKKKNRTAQQRPLFDIQIKFGSANIFRFIISSVTFCAFPRVRKGNTDMIFMTKSVEFISHDRVYNQGRHQ